VAALDATTGAPVWIGTANGDVRALAMSADGSRVLAGGAFTTVTGVTHRKLASLDVADGTADPTWKAAAGGTVRDIVVQGDTAYFAGAFTSHAGMTQMGLGAVSVSTGKNVTDFTTTTDGIVYALATDGTRLYFAGKFTAVDGLPRNQVASVTLATRTLDLWAPPRMCTECNVDWDMTTANGVVYVVGRNGGAVVAFDALTGLPRWRVNRANGDAQAVTLFDGRLWVGGHFTTINALPRVTLAAFNPATGVLDPVSARFVTTYPGIWALGSSSNRLYVGGHFTAAGPKPNRFPYFAMFGAG
jgi:outer membrane protein assembly factor BamB